MAYTEVDAAIDKLDRRRAQVSGLRYVLLLLAFILLVGGVGTAAFQMRRSIIGNPIDTLGEVASVSYFYLMALLWGGGGLIGFLFFGWFAAVCHIEAAQLEATVILERAKQRAMS
jgi:hypothetical protein